MSYNIYTPSHYWHYLLAFACTAAVLLLELNVPRIGTGLTVVPFVFITSVFAMIACYGSGIFAILISGVAVTYTVMQPEIQLGLTPTFKVFEFLVVTSVIFVLSWRGRTLYASNIVLKEMTRSLQDITEDLRTQVKGDTKKVKQLNDVNKKLVTLVDQFIKDDEYWARKITTPLTPLPRQIKNELYRRGRFTRLHH